MRLILAIVAMFISASSFADIYYYETPNLYSSDGSRSKTRTAIICRKFDQCIKTTDTVTFYRNGRYKEIINDKKI